MATHVLDKLQQSAPADVKSTKNDGLDLQKRAATVDDKATGNMLANEVFATIQQHHRSVWRNFAVRLMDLNHEARKAFISAIKAQIKGWKTANQLDGAVDKKAAAARVNSATVEASKLATIANAWNKGASVEGLIAYATIEGYNPPSFDDVSYTMMVEYARTFSTKKQGRPAHGILTKFGKWLETVGEGDTEEDVAIKAKLVKFYNELNAGNEKAAAPF